MAMRKTGSYQTGTLDRPHVLLSSRRRRAVTAGVLLGMCLAALEATVVSTAMPTVIASLGGLGRYSWVFSAYLLTSTVSVPVWGRLSDLYGRRPLYLAGVFFFLAGSALSGMSSSIDQLIVFRAVQGLGAGGLVPLSLTINGDIYTVRERTRIQGLFSGMWGLASILGPLAGGFITDQLSWRWVFYLNIPFGLAAAVIVGTTLAEPKREGRPVIDYQGAAWLALSITLLLLALVESGEGGAIKSPLVILSAAGFFLSGLLFVRTERRAVEPIVPFSLFRNKVVTVGLIIVALVGTALFGALSFIPLFVQGVLGGSATEAGSVLTPLLLGWVTLSLVGGRLMLRVGYRPTVLSGLVILAASFAALSRIGSATPRWLVLADMGFLGCGMGLVTLALLITMQNTVPRNQLGIATSLNLFGRSIGGAIGVAVMGAILTMGLSSQLASIEVSAAFPKTDIVRLGHNPNALIEPAERRSLDPKLLAALEAGLATALRRVFTIGAIFAALALVAGFWLPADWSGPEAVGAEPGEWSSQDHGSPSEEEPLLTSHSK
jgi:EmrB/QacA subfamily drug resistance transporter